MLLVQINPIKRNLIGIGILATLFWGLAFPVFSLSPDSRFIKKRNWEAIRQALKKELKQQNTLAALRQTFWNFSNLIHPDKNPQEKHEAEKIFKELKQLFRQRENEIKRMEQGEGAVGNEKMPDELIIANIGSLKIEPEVLRRINIHIFLSYVFEYLNGGHGSPSARRVGLDLDSLHSLTQDPLLTVFLNGFILLTDPSPLEEGKRGVALSKLKYFANFPGDEVVRLVAQIIVYYGAGKQYFLVENPEKEILDIGETSHKPLVHILSKGFFLLSRQGSKDTSQGRSALDALVSIGNSTQDPFLTCLCYLIEFFMWPEESPNAQKAIQKLIALKKRTNDPLVHELIWGVEVFGRNRKMPSVMDEHAFEKIIFLRNQLIQLSV